jgi:hypothetical protein
LRLIQAIERASCRQTRQCRAFRRAFIHARGASEACRGAYNGRHSGPVEESLSFLRAASRNSKYARKITRHPWKAILYGRKWTGSICGMIYRMGRYPEGDICPGPFHAPALLGERCGLLFPSTRSPENSYYQIDNVRKSSFTGVDQTGCVTLEPAH